MSTPGNPYEPPKSTPVDAPRFFRGRIIPQERSRALHLLLASPTAAYTAGLLFLLSFGIGNLEFAWGSFGELTLVPFAALAIAAYMLPIAIVVGVPAYFWLRSENLLQLHIFILVGIIPGLLVGLATDFLFAIAFATIGAFSGAVAYKVLAVMARRTSAARAVVGGA